MSTGQRVIVILVVLFFGLVALASPVLMIGGFFLFDAPGATENPLVWIAAVSIWLVPVACVVSVPASIVMLWRRSDFEPTIRVALLPLVPIGVVTFCMGALQVMCDGRLAC